MSWTERTLGLKDALLKRDIAVHLGASKLKKYAFFVLLLFVFDIQILGLVLVLNVWLRLAQCRLNNNTIKLSFHFT